MMAAIEEQDENLAEVATNENDQVVTEPLVSFAEDPLSAISVAMVESPVVSVAAENDHDVENPASNKNNSNNQINCPTERERYNEIWPPQEVPPYRPLNLPDVVDDDHDEQQQVEIEVNPSPQLSSDSDDNDHPSENVGDDVDSSATAVAASGVVDVELGLPTQEDEDEDQLGYERYIASLVENNNSTQTINNDATAEGEEQATNMTCRSRMWRWTRLFLNIFLFPILLVTSIAIPVVIVLLCFALMFVAFVVLLSIYYCCSPRRGEGAVPFHVLIRQILDAVEDETSGEGNDTPKYSREEIQNSLVRRKLIQFQVSNLDGKVVKDEEPKDEATREERMHQDMFPIVQSETTTPLQSEHTKSGSSLGEEATDPEPTGFRGFRKRMSANKSKRKKEKEKEVEVIDHNQTYAFRLSEKNITFKTDPVSSNAKLFKLERTFVFSSPLEPTKIIRATSTDDNDDNETDDDFDVEEYRQYQLALAALEDDSDSDDSSPFGFSPVIPSSSSSESSSSSSSESSSSTTSGMAEEAQSSDESFLLTDTERSSQVDNPTAPAVEPVDSVDGEDSKIKMASVIFDQQRDKHEVGMESSDPHESLDEMSKCNQQEEADSVIDIEGWLERKKALDDELLATEKLKVENDFIQQHPATESDSESAVAIHIIATTKKSVDRRVAAALEDSNVKPDVQELSRADSDASKEGHDEEYPEGMPEKSTNEGPLPSTKIQLPLAAPGSSSDSGSEETKTEVQASVDPTMKTTTMERAEDLEAPPLSTAATTDTPASSTPGNTPVATEAISSDAHSASKLSQDHRGISSYCTICLMEYEEGDIVVWSRRPHGCHHAMHEDCLLDWLQRKPTCPNCRQEYFAIEDSPVPPSESSGEDEAPAVVTDMDNTAAAEVSERRRRGGLFW